MPWAIFATVVGSYARPSTCQRALCWPMGLVIPSLAAMMSPLTLKTDMANRVQTSSGLAAGATDENLAN